MMMTIYLSLAGRSSFRIFPQMICNMFEITIILFDAVHSSRNRCLFDSEPQVYSLFLLVKTIKFIATIQNRWKIE